MAADIRITGSSQLSTLGLRLKEAGAGKVRRELLAAIRAGAQPALPDIRSSARANLPRAGGLGEQVADQPFSVRTSLAASGGRVSIRGTGMKELRDINAGRVRHPVWGNRDVWKQQEVPEGFFSEPIEKKAPSIREQIAIAMTNIARQIGRGL